MPILSDANRAQVSKHLGQMGGPVTALLLPAPGEDPYAESMRELLGELQELTEHLQVEEAAADSPRAQELGLDRFPALVLLDRQGRDRGVRFAGAPMGYEFMTLLEDLVDLSRDQTRLSEQGRQAIRAIAQDLTIEVFTTPT